MKAIPDACHKDGQLSSRALRDMIKEAQFLSVLSHPNILSLRGVSADMDAESSKDCFLEYNYERNIGIVLVTGSK